jgi:hypothetical protein
MSCKYYDARTDFLRQEYHVAPREAPVRPQPALTAAHENRFGVSEEAYASRLSKFGIGGRPR